MLAIRLKPRWHANPTPAKLNLNSFISLRAYHLKKPTKPVAVKPAKTASGEQKSTRKVAVPSKPVPKATAKVVAVKKPTPAKAAVTKPARVASARVIDLRTTAGVTALSKASKTAGARSKPAAKSTVKRGETPRVIDLRTTADVARLNKASAASSNKSATAKKSAAPKKTATALGAKPKAAAVKTPVQLNLAIQPKSAKGEVKAKRSRVPADLAAQYGEKTATSTRVVVEEAPLRKPRRTAAARAKLQQALKPDEGILARLERAKTAGMTKKRVPSRRSKNWNARCGRCGSQVNLATPAGLCPKCGAILMRGED